MTALERLLFVVVVFVLMLGIGLLDDATPMWSRLPLGLVVSTALAWFVWRWSNPQ